MKVSKHDFEKTKESIESEIRGFQLTALELKRDIAENQVKAVEWDKEKSSEDIRKARLGYENAKIGNDITEEKQLQLKDTLQFEKAMTLIGKENYLVAGKSALLALQQAQTDLEQNGELFELKYDRRLSYEGLKL